MVLKKIVLVILILATTVFGLLINNPGSEIELVVNGESLAPEKPVKSENDILYIPAETLLENLGFQTVWDADNEILYASLGDFQIDFPIGSREITVNKNIVTLAAPAEIFNEVVYLPVRAAEEALGVFVKWDEETGVINVVTPQEFFDPDKRDDQETPLLNLAYPPKTRHIYYGHSLFVFGTTQSYSQILVTVNGDPVDIFDPRTGNFLTMVDIPRGEEFPIIVEATDLNGTTMVKRSVLYPAPWQPMPGEPLTVHDKLLVPAEDQILRLGDTLMLAVQGSPGADAGFLIGGRGNRVDMRELAYPAGPSGEGGIYTAFYKITSQVVPTSGSSGLLKINVSLQKDKKVVNRELPGRVRFISETPYKIIEVKEEHELKNRGWLYVMRPGNVQLYAATLGGTGYSTSAVSYLVEGTRYEAVGMSGSYYRVNLYGDEIFLIHKDMVRELQGMSSLEPSLKGIELVENVEKISLVLLATERFPFLVEDGNNKLTFNLYGPVMNESLVLPALPEYLTDLKLEPARGEKPGSLVVTIEFEKNITGFRGRWDENNLVIDIYKPPIVNRETPLKGKTIIIDPGHGGEDIGAIGPGLIHEKDVVLPISLHLREMLTEDGAIVIMTRTGDEFINIYDRPERIDQYNADLFISVHANAHAQDAPATEIRGLMTLFNYAHNEELAEIMLGTMAEEMGLPAFKTWKRIIAVLRHPHIPSVLVEVGYMMHPEDNWHILHPRGQKEFAGAIREGIYNYYLSFTE